MKILLSWATAFIVLFFYYDYYQFPMERSFIKGLNYERNNEDARASNEFNKIIEAYPQYTPAYINLARIYSKNGNWSEYVVNSNKTLINSVITAEDLTERGLIFYRHHIQDNQIRRYNKIISDHYLLNLFQSYESNK